MKYQPVQNYVKGSFINSAASRKLDVISPLDGIKLSEVPMSAASDLDEAVRAAQAVFPHLSKTPIKDSMQVFFKFKTLLEKNLQELAELCSEENGKTIGESI